jgi:hypothetical protein
MCSRGHLVNYFNPAFSWYESLFGPADLQKTLAAFPIVLQGSGANAPFTTLGGLDNTWVQGRRASALLHQRQSGVDGRRARAPLRNQHPDLPAERLRFRRRRGAAGHLHDLAAVHLRRGIDASETFPLADSQPYNFLNLDFYAQDTWKVTRKLTWTFGIRDTYNSNPLNPHDAVARLAGSFDFHFPRCESAAEPGHSDAAGNGFRRHAGCDPAAANRHRVADRAAHGAAHGFGLFSDICRAAWSIWWERILPTRRRSRADCWARWAERRLRREFRTAPSMRPRREPAIQSGFAQGELSCASPLANPNACLPPISITAVPDGKLHAPYFMQWSFALEHQVGNTINLRAQYVGTRAVNQPYETQVNGYQTVCQGCFAPFPYGSPRSALRRR